MLVSLLLLVLADGPLEAARRDVRRLNYVAAVKSLDHAAQSPLSWDDARSWFELRGIVAASTGDSAKAGQTFEQLLTLDPQWALSGRYAPRVTTPFYEARGRAREHGALKLTFSRATDHQLHFGLADPLNQAKHVEFEVTEGGATRLVVLTPAPEITVPFSEGMVTVRAVVRGAHGWAFSPVVEAVFTVPVSVASLAAPEPASAVTPPPIVAVASSQPSSHWPPLGASLVLGASIAALGTGIGFGISSSNARSQLSAATASGQLVTTLTRARALVLSDRAATHGAIADGCFVGAALSLGLAVVWWLWFDEPTTHVVAVTPRSSGNLRGLSW